LIGERGGSLFQQIIVNHRPLPNEHQTSERSGCVQQTEVSGAKLPHHPGANDTDDGGGTTTSRFVSVHRTICHLSTASPIIIIGHSFLNQDFGRQRNGNVSLNSPNTRTEHLSDGECQKTTRCGSRGPRRAVEPARSIAAPAAAPGTSSERNI
jgi:hypothetical protein